MFGRRKKKHTPVNVTKKLEDLEKQRQKKTAAVDVNAMLRKLDRIKKGQEKREADKAAMLEKRFPLDEKLTEQIRERELKEGGPIMMMDTERVYHVEGTEKDIEKAAKNYIDSPVFHESRDPSKYFPLCGVLQQEPSKKKGGKHAIFVISPTTKILYKMGKNGLEKDRTLE